MVTNHVEIVGKNKKMIKLSNGYELEFLAASGALGLYGKGYWWEYPLKLIYFYDILGYRQFL